MPALRPHGQDVANPGPAPYRRTSRQRLTNDKCVLSLLDDAGDRQGDAQL